MAGQSAARAAFYDATIRGAVSHLLPPHTASAVIHEALRSAGLGAIPNDAAAMVAFVQGPLQEAAARYGGPQTGELLLALLQPLTSKTAKSGVQLRSPAPREDAPAQAGAHGYDEPGGDPWRSPTPPPAAPARSSLRGRLGGESFEIADEPQSSPPLGRRLHERQHSQLRQVAGLGSDPHDARSGGYRAPAPDHELPRPPAPHQVPDHPRQAEYVHRLTPPEPPPQRDPFAAQAEALHADGRAPHAPPSPVPSHPPEDGPSDGPPPARPATIVVTGLRMNARMELTNLLRARGHRVVFAPDGNIALAMCTRSVPDVLIAELDMPGLDGASLTAALHHALGARTPVVLLLSDDGEREVPQGAAVLSRPFTPEDLLGALDWLLWQRG